MNDHLLREAISALKRGWVLIPLEGKVPIGKAWPKAKAPSEETVTNWVRAGKNIGVVTGKASGIVVIDVDPGGQHPTHETPTVETGRGGRHYYFQYHPVKNSAGKLSKNVDVRGDGGQVVLPGSIHPDTGQPYRWIVHPDECALAPYPDTQRIRSKNTTRIPSGASVESETARVMAAPEGARNQTLNLAAFKLGQAVASGEIAHEEARAALLDAALAVGLSEREALATIKSGLSAGSVPRGTHTPTPSHVSEAGPETSTVLVPGAHVDDNGELLEVGVEQFARRVLELLPPGCLYRRERVVGQISEGAFRFVNATQVRRMVDKFCKLAKWGRDAEDQPILKFVPASADHGELVLSAAAESVRRLELLTNYPVYAPHLLKHGWNEEAHAYVDCQMPEPLPLAESVSTLSQLTVDFPWGDIASRENFLGLMLTPLLRPAFDGPVPMHMIQSPVERCGKTKLAEEVFGGVILGRPTPALQLAGHDEERDKRIVSLLISARGLVHLDNIGEFLDSAALASLITSRTYSGRLLGKSEIVELPNTLTIVATANNPRATGEIVKRCVPILLMPKDDSPESRTGFVHPDLPGYVRENRQRILAALLGLIEHWKKLGSPPGSRPMGGFEGWARMVGGILQSAGYELWRCNTGTWAAEADTHGQDLRVLVKEWRAMYADTMVTTQQLFQIAKDKELFDHVFLRNGDKAHAIAFGRLISKQAGRVVGQFRITRYGEHNHRSFCLQLVSPPDSP